ncbi:hypothetical protein [Nostoc sp.]|uniref:hypothetical protein n=1 Tax=Nostoc sp. TaxID=1180 RepID=UPI002FF82461
MDEQLTRSVIEAKQYPSESEERKQALNKLVEQILSSRSICRPYKGKPLWGIYQEIYELAREQLVYDIDEEIDKYNSQRTNTREWIKSIRDKAFREVLNNTRLTGLALEAQGQPAGEPIPEPRQYALGELLEAIRLSGKLSHPYQSKFNSEFYKLLYDEAVNRTFFFVFQKIDDYDPNKAEVLAWINNKLGWEVLNARQEFSWIDQRQWISKDKTKTPSLLELEQIAKEQEINGDKKEQLTWLELREYIKEDPENLFKKEHIEEQPKANFQAIALERFAGKNWKEISAKYGIVGQSTCSSFFWRCCKKFRHNFAEHLE